MQNWGKFLGTIFFREWQFIFLIWPSREQFFSKPWWIKPKSDWIYLFPIHLESNGLIRLLPNHSENGKYNLKKILANKDFEKKICAETSFEQKKKQKKKNNKRKAFVILAHWNGRAYSHNRFFFFHFFFHCQQNSPANMSIWLVWLSYFSYNFSYNFLSKFWRAHTK